MLFPKDVRFVIQRAEAATRICGEDMFLTVVFFQPTFNLHNTQENFYKNINVAFKQNRI